MAKGVVRNVLASFVILASTACSIQQQETLSNKSSSLSQESFRTFSEWCINRVSLSKEARYTVDALLAQTDTEIDCKG